MRACTQTVCFSNMENNEMNNTDTLEKIIRHQKNKDPAYPFREHLLMQLCIRTNKRMQDNISEFLGVYGINHSDIWFSPHYSQRRVIVCHLQR